MTDAERLRSIEIERRGVTVKIERNTSVFGTYAVYCVLMFILAIFTYAFAEAGEPGGPVQQRIIDAYKTMVDIQGEFSQVSRIKELEETKTARGRFYIRMPDRVRWDYIEPTKQTVIITGDEMLMRQGENGEVMKRSLNSTVGNGVSFTPIGLLSNLGDMSRTFVVKPEPDGAQAVLLIPRSDMGSVKSIQIETDTLPSTKTNSTFPIRSLRIVDLYGNINTFTLKNVQVNTGLGDDLFVP